LVALQGCHFPRAILDIPYERPANAASRPPSGSDGLDLVAGAARDIWMEVTHVGAIKPMTA
jgi:hypothetical protein